MVVLRVTNLRRIALTPSLSRCVYNRAFTMVRHVSRCRHPANSFINDLRVWYSPRKKNRKTCSCPSKSHWHGALYRADWTSEWREWEREFRLVLNSTVIPSGYLCGHIRSLCDIPSMTVGAVFTIPSTLYKTQLFQSLSPVSQHMGHFQGRWRHFTVTS